MKPNQIYPNLYLYTFPNQFELCTHFFRLQEFYESPSKELRGNYFSLEDAISFYAYDQKDEPEFTYFTDWNGFNVPGNIVNKFIDCFDADMTENEIILLHEVDHHYEENFNKYYIIGVVEGEEDTMKHEVAHGFYYLNKAYKKEMDNLFKQLPDKVQARIKDALLSRGYCKQVVKDETQAYLATGIMEGMFTIVDYIRYWYIIKQFKITFDKYYEKNIT